MSHGVIFDFIQRLRDCPSQLEILGDGRAEKNYILVEECIAGMLYVLARTQPGFEVLNLGSPTTTAVNEIARIVIEEMSERGRTAMPEGLRLARRPAPCT
jgi:UDP-glucose 4-epimerase